MRHANHISLYALDIRVTTENNIEVQQDDDTIVISPAQVPVFVDSLQAALEALRQAGKA